jgi:hypothetical protein
LQNMLKVVASRVDKFVLKLATIYKLLQAVVAQFVQYIELTERPLPLSEFESTEVDLSVQ